MNVPCGGPRRKENRKRAIIALTIHQTTTPTVGSLSVENMAARNNAPIYIQFNSIQFSRASAPAFGGGGWNPTPCHLCDLAPLLVWVSTSSTAHLYLPLHLPFL